MCYCFLSHVYACVYYTDMLTDCIELPGLWIHLDIFAHAVCGPNSQICIQTIAWVRVVDNLNRAYH